MARLTLLLIVLLSVAFVIVSGGNNTNSSTTPATPKAPNAKPPSIPGAGTVTKLIEAAEEIPKAIVNTCVDAIASFLKMLVDIPLALVEAFRDGAEGIEKIVLGSLRTFF
ncbi:hypothetical protein RR46_05150 [Papilio xuthus]|uniref:Uncharacterized protein n=1 Tax=Papilio xuthus TaxID=66420 RepID=A0A194QEP9_PAPXU|nr:hypothetical protein RR46_05150 [Papilio xuthus]